MTSQSLWSEYEGIMELARIEFGHLRDLPLYGRKQWESYFQKAFQLYAHVWKFQQDNRADLTDEGLKRWEIGDVASRIGQLYYNYYLRTSGLNFLTESYVFYEAIHERGYFESEEEEDLLVKQLRFYTRFIIVCLLLNKRDDVWDHLEKLEGLVDEFAKEAQPTDVLEWRAVIQETQHFLAADSPVSRSHEAGRHALTLQVRCQLESPLAGIPFTAPFLRLHEALLVSYYHRQVKLGEIPLDTFRMLQALEWEDPTASGSVSPDNQYRNGEWADTSVQHENPAKYLLYRPTASQVLAVLATACETLPPVSAFLVYLSAAEDHVRATNSASRQQLVEGSSAEPTPDCSQDEEAEPSGLCLSPPSSSGLDESYLYPEDLLPHTRRPLFLVVDSDNSRAFRSLAGRERSYPPCCLMSPILQPPEVCLATKSGRLFTLFLTNPVMAMCLLVNLDKPNSLLLAKIQSVIDGVLYEWGENLALLAGMEWNDAWVGMFGDVLLRRLILRFLLCRAALTLHRDFGKIEDFQPTCFPPFPRAVSTQADVVVDGIHHIAAAMNCEELFLTSEETRRLSYSESASWEAGLRLDPGTVLSIGALSRVR